MWLTVETEETVEIVPNYGREHVLGADCWCVPEVEHLDKDLVIHGLEN